MFSKITDQIYLASAKDVTASNLRHTPVTVILNVASDVHDIRIAGVRNEKEGFMDDARQAVRMAGPAIARLVRLLKNGEVVVVHCQGGASRSPHVVASALAEIQGKSYDEVYAELRQLHPRTIAYSIGQEIRDKGLS